jgi:hypothetical protein
MLEAAARGEIMSAFMRAAVAAIVAVVALIAASGSAAESHQPVHVSGSASVFVWTGACPGFASGHRFGEFGEIGVFLDSTWNSNGTMSGEPLFYKLTTRITGSGTDPGTSYTYQMKGSLSLNGSLIDLLGYGDVRITRNDGMVFSGSAYFNWGGPGSPEIVFGSVSRCG